jgi:hypothetical protein
LQITFLQNEQEIPAAQRWFTMTGKRGGRLTIPYWQALADLALFPLLFPNFPEPYHRGIRLRDVQGGDDNLENFGNFIAGVLFY